MCVGRGEVECVCVGGEEGKSVCKYSLQVCMYPLTQKLTRQVGPVSMAGPGRNCQWFSRLVNRVPSVAMVCSH